MALYDPIRDGFNDFNRMLIDAQQWEAQHKAREQEKVYQDTVLQSNLVQREFENQMTEKRHTLAINQDTRAATQLDEAIADQSFRHKMANDTLGIQRDNLEINQKELEMKQVKHVQDMRVVTAQANELEEPWIPRPVNIGGMFPEHVMQNPEALAAINAIAEQTLDASLGGDGNLKSLQEDGTPGDMLMSNRELENYTPAFLGLKARYDNPTENAQINIQTIRGQQAELKKYEKSLGGDNYNNADKAAARRQINKLEGDVRQQAKALTPAAILNAYKVRAQDSYNSASWLRAKGMKGMAEAQEKLALELLEKAAATSKLSKGQLSPVFMTELKDGKAQSAGYEVSINPDNGQFTRTDPEGNVVTSPRLPEGHTLLKPTEDFISKSTAAKGQQQVTGLMTETQMKDVAPLYQAEGMLAVLSTDAVKPKISQMRTIIGRAHRRLGSKPEDRSFVQGEVVQKVEELELGYWDQSDKLKTKDIGDVRAALSALGIKVEKGASERALLEQYYYDDFANAVRQVAGDKNMRIYRPNKTTRQMAMGLGN